MFLAGKVDALLPLNGWFLVWVLTVAMFLAGRVVALLPLVATVLVLFLAYIVPTAHLPVAFFPAPVMAAAAADVLSAARCISVTFAAELLFLSDETAEQLPIAILFSSSDGHLREIWLKYLVRAFPLLEFRTCCGIDPGI